MVRPLFLGTQFRFGFYSFLLFVKRDKERKRNTGPLKSEMNLFLSFQFFFIISLIYLKLNYKKVKKWK